MGRQITVKKNNASLHGCCSYLKYLVEKYLSISVLLANNLVADGTE